VFVLTQQTFTTDRTWPISHFGEPDGSSLFDRNAARVKAVIEFLQEAARQRWALTSA
jgi:hypothetical protein